MSNISSELIKKIKAHVYYTGLHRYELTSKGKVFQSDSFKENPWYIEISNFQAPNYSRQRMESTFNSFESFRERTDVNNQLFKCKSDRKWP